MSPRPAIRRGWFTPALAAALLVAAPLRAAEPTGDPLLDTLSAELERSMAGLSLPDTPPPYFLSYQLLDTRHAYAIGSFGALQRSSESRARPLTAEVRVGGYDLDNANFASFGDDPAGLTHASLVLDDDPVAVARDLWLVTDEAYKTAVAGLARKQAALSSSGDEPRAADLARIDPLVQIDPAPVDAAARARMEALARRLSAPLADVEGIDHARVYAADTAWKRYLVTSEGTRVADRGRITVVRVIAEAHADDGAAIKDVCSWIARSPDQLPDDATMDAAVAALTDRLRAARGAPPAEDYLGPVVFEGAAAAELFRHLLVPQLMGTPQELSGGEWSVGEQRPLARLGRRVLPPGFTVADDPAGAEPGDIGHFQVDDEGVPAQRVELVRDGVVGSLLMSRTPRLELPASNGHGRGVSGSRTVGMPGVMSVTQARGWPEHKVYAQAFRMARQAGLDHVLVVRQLDDPALRTAASVRRIRFDDDGGPSLPEPLQVVRRYADGREQPLRNVRLFSADHRLLRDVVAVSRTTVHHAYLAPPILHGGNEWVSGPTGGVPVTLVAPAAVLVAEIEAGHDAGAAGPLPLLASPLDHP